jgi:hypothetical protein
MSKIKPGTYKHYKGKFYEVIGVAHHSETLEEFVVYRALYSTKKFGKNSLWIRPRKMFFEKLKINTKLVPRFELLV